MRHPIRGNKLTPLELTLWRFRMVAHESQVMVRGLERYPDVASALNEDILFGLSNQALILVSKFLEIWDALGSQAKIDNRVIPCRRALSPLVDRMQVWRGLRDFRNCILAHAYLDSVGRPVDPRSLIENGDVPTRYAEAILLLHLVHLGVLGILTVFEAEYLPIDILFAPRTPSLIENGIGVKGGAEIVPELDKLGKLVDLKLLKHCDVEVKGQLRSTFKAALVPDDV